MSKDVVWLFPGQGSQSLGMGQRLYAESRIFADAFDRISATCEASLGTRLDTLLFASQDPEKLTETRFAQPALFAVQYAMGKLLVSLDHKPRALFGHSVGEFAAATLAGVFDVEAAAKLVCERGRLMHSMPPGSMLAVALSAEKCQNLDLAGLEIAGYNAPDLTVLGGPSVAVADLHDRLVKDDVTVFPVETSHAFHTSSMQQAADDFKDCLDQVELRPPTLPLMACAVGKPMTPELATSAQYWSDQIRRPVRFVQGMQHLATAGEAQFWEVGPGRALTGNAKRSGVKSCIALQPSPEVASISSVQVAISQVQRAPTEADQTDVDLPNRVAKLVGDFTGAVPQGPERDSTFAALGLDSLLLTQIATAVRRQFGVELKFRRLLEDLHNVNVLANWLAEQAPDASGIPTPARHDRRQTTAEGPAAARVGVPFGAQAKVEREAGAELDPEQRAAIDAFTARYTSKTRGSKSFTQRNRLAMADPRVVSGFNPVWKELVYPIVANRSSGCRVWDLDGNEYIDVVSGFGSTYLGYQPPAITQAIRKQIDDGYELGPQHPLTADVTQLIQEMTGVERVAFCNTGSEAVMGAMRSARTVTGRDLIVIFTDSYHGIFDEVIVRGTPTLRSIAAAPGILASAVENVLVLKYGEDDSLQIIRERADEIAAVMVEPIQRRNPTLQPRAFLQEVRKITKDADAALIFDEIITGFRVALGGAQEFFGVHADLVTYGKVIGGGLPLAAIAGDQHWMDALDGGDWQFGDDSVPEAGVTYFAGTFVRHPLALAASKAALLEIREIGNDGISAINDRVTHFVSSLNAMFKSEKVAIFADHFATIVRITIDQGEPLAPMLYFYLRNEGVHIYEGFGMFLGAHHQQPDLDELLARCRRAVIAMRDDKLLSADWSAPSDPTQFPLTLNQQEIWLACQMDEQAIDAYRETFVLRLSGAANTEHLFAAVDLGIARHEALHVRFALDGQFQTRHAPDSTIVELHESDEPSSAQRSTTLLERAERLRDLPIVFDKDRPFRAELVRFDDHDHALVFSAHHLVYDGWSENVLLEDIASIYRQLCGAEETLPNPQLYSRYARYQRELLGSEKSESDRAYWVEQLSDLPSPLDLPTDRPRTKQRGYRSGTLSFPLQATTVAALESVSKRHNTTTYSVLLTAYYLLLARLAGQNDVIIGVPTAGQADTEFEHVVGHCVQMLPLRLSVPLDQPLGEVINAVTHAILDAREHGSISFGAILELLSVERDTSRPTLISASFNVDPKLGVLDFGTASAELDHLPAVGLNEELKTNVIVTEDGLQILLSYNSGLFDQETAKQWADIFEGLIRAFETHAERNATSIPLVGEAQGHIILDAGRGERFASNYRNIPEMIADGLHQSGDNDLLLGDQETLTGSQVDNEIERIAGQLITLGIRANDRVGVALSRSTDWVLAFAGVLRSGATYVALDPANPARRLESMMTTAGVHTVICDETPNVLSNVRCVRLDELRKPTTGIGELPALSSMAPSSLAVVLFTSGSTGTPKAVALTHDNFVARMSWDLATRPLLPADTWLLGASVSFDISVYQALCILIAGVRGVVVAEGLQYDPPALIDLIDRHGVTHAHFPPSMLRLLLEQHSQQGGLGSLRHLLTGGERVDVGLVNQIHQQLDVEFIARYGPTEATVDVTEWATTKQSAPYQHAPIGKAQPNSEVFIVDAEGSLVPFGIPGEIVIGGRQVSQGYLGLDSPEPGFRSSSMAESHSYYTGDLGRMEADGTVHFLGRADNQIKLRGQRIELSEIERALLDQNAIVDAVAVVSGAGIDASISAFITTNASVDLETLRLALHDWLPPHMIPRDIVSVGSLPRTQSGKVDRRALSAMAAEEPRLTHDRKPETEMEQLVSEWWQEVLDRSELPVAGDFFTLGGHSLLAFRVVALARQGLDIEIPVRDLFDAPTIETFALKLEGRLDAALESMSDDAIDAALSETSDS